jgi:class III poly(R)-hydroxyalkanoic acid synthase PhaE subunit
MSGTQDYFNTWLKAQQDAFASVGEMTRKFQQNFSGFGSAGGAMPGFGAAMPGFGGAVPGFGGFQDAYATWEKSVNDALRGSGAPDANFIRETLLKSLSSSNAYMKAYELWLPLFKAIQQKSVSPDSFKDLIDPAKFKEMMDRVFGFNPDAASQLAEQVKSLLESYAHASQGFVNPWVEASRKGFNSFPQIMEGHPESFMKIFHTMFGAFDSTVGRVFHVPAVGKDREKVELLLRSLDVLSVYLAKNTEFEHTMYVTGLAASEKMIAAIADKVKDGGEFKDFGEFFNLWITVNEKAYAELFQTEDYAKMQGELLEAALNVRTHSFKLTELYLYDLPIALRSEMDDLYKTVYELKKKVKKMEKQLGEVSA